MNKALINELIESWINGNKSHVYQQYKEDLNEVERAYFLYYLDANDQSSFCRYLEAVND